MAGTTGEVGRPAGRCRAHGPAIRRRGDGGAYRDEAFARSLAPARLALSQTCVFYALFGLIDGYALPHLRAFIQAFRYAFICPLAFGLILLTRSRHARRSLRPALFAFWLASFAAIVSASLGTHPALRHHCFALLMLSMLTCNMMIGLPFAATATLSTAAFLAYAAAALAIGDRPLEQACAGPVHAARARDRGGHDGVHRRAGRALRLPATPGHRGADEQLRAAFREVEEARREAEDASRVDPLTALFNRRHFFEEAGPGAVSAIPRSVIILDVDHFKAVNDAHGHAVGDQVLRAVAARILENVRPGDVPCRYGGEEFAILLPGADVREAAAVGERLREGVAARAIDTAKGPIAVSVSVGIAAAIEGALHLDLLVDRADQALYQAKHGGRNNVRLWRPDALAG